MNHQLVVSFVKAAEVKGVTENQEFRLIIDYVHSLTAGDDPSSTYAQKVQQQKKNKFVAAFYRL